MGYLNAIKSLEQEVDPLVAAPTTSTVVEPEVVTAAEPTPLLTITINLVPHGEGGTRVVTTAPKGHRTLCLGMLSEAEHLIKTQLDSDTD